ncbi:hypothetical protein AKJ37_03435 [candidate division MSBL1 archaeon SCGC-AAA259I09]|uniref:Isochorismatase-like domain-containing protein n=3 Tax=candidate division MSBL1 TaxID=215777 RepID=A0A133USK4_9EURY|nr:hypothetical protein AKJ37_03435 [candidate division MSBL1 archaeon SCGC-AAA259I09]KXA98134.1 hypothetical protein AKJ40_04920 [candidate division MSBL1 archaeon SCGC-AAA259M10]KXA98261.1 hypothetical protein AKJ39_02330 [candidate division MSBL1 archaeon SCGC-AAA259J03]
MRVASTAVLLVGFQNEFCSEGGAFHDIVKGEIESSGAVKNAADLVEQGRERGVKILHVPMQFSENFREIPPDRTGMLGDIRKANAFVMGTDRADIVEELGPEPNDVVISGKSTIAAFKSTNLDHVLRNFGIKNLALAGLLTDVSVESTARAAYDLGYRVVLLRDCTATRSKEAHLASERVIESSFGRVMSHREFLNNLE